MKRIGMIGGMSWESSLSYYRWINEGVKKSLGGLHSADLLLHSVNFHEIEMLQRAGRWKEAGDVLAAAGRGLAQAGADFLMICTNTMHKVARQVEEGSGIPLLHIADATGERICVDGLEKVGLLGTSFTMEEDFYKGRLAENFGLEVLVPDEKARAEVHRVIYEELCRGQVKASSQRFFLETVEALCQRGAEGVILGCTEIGLLVPPEVSVKTLYDTTKVHVDAAVALTLEG